MPLARIKELLAADPDQFAAAIAEIDRDLADRPRRLRRTRERIAQLRAGDRLFVSAEVADYLDQLHHLGVSERTVQMERDMWILMQSVSPKEAATGSPTSATALDDPEFRAIYLEYDAAFDWSPDDPRLPVLADRTQRWLANRHMARPPGAADPGPDHRPASQRLGRVVAGLGPAHRDRSAAPVSVVATATMPSALGGLVAGWACRWVGLSLGGLVAGLSLGGLVAGWACRWVGLSLDSDDRR